MLQTLVLFVAIDDVFFARKEFAEETLSAVEFVVLIEFFELLEAMAVDDLLEPTIGIVENAAIVVENHHLAVFGCVGLPKGQTGRIGIAIVCKLRPRAAHQVGQSQIGIGWFGQVVRGMMERVEAEHQLLAMDGTLVERRTPGEHIHIGGSLARLGDGIGRD